MKNPIKLNFKTEIVPILIILASFVASFYFYSNFPKQVATHWNFAGEPDAYSGKTFAAFFFPVLILGIYLLMTFIPMLDPKKERYAQFIKPYLIFRSIFVLFMTAIYFIASIANLGYDLNIGAWIASLVGVLFIVLGNYMGKIKNNWFVGVRTPWTLSSEEVWNKTHRFSGRVFIAAGILIALTGFAPAQLRLPLFIIAILSIVFGTIIYSYIIYLKEKKQ
ncbi:DUF1648 domain-containing protein [Candidatus Falkowbacteria bacterium]|nr:DUF1648 domain-containing protein [Candidatus Falkowbacteria bacterium]